MRLAFERMSAIVLLASVVGCAGGRAGSTTGVGSGVWTGSFRQPSTAASAVVGPATPGRAAAFGNLTLTPTGNPGRYRVELSISAPVEPNTQLAWAIFSGPCGSPGPAVAGINEFPSIEIGSSGGAVRTVMSFGMEPRGSYHANVYWNSHASDVSNVMMCANLAFNA